MSPRAAVGRPLVTLEGLAKRFGDHAAVRGVDLTLLEGEFFALLGPSGCGKTTLLRMLAGFEAPDEGRVILDGQDITETPPHRRPLHMMFQSYALFPHLSVEENVAFGLRRQGAPRAEIADRVTEVLALVRLGPLARRKPHQLSGGERQRVALARALAPRPRLLLLDEPMAALDKKLREETQAELAALQRRLGLTFVIVTHDQDEAMALADRLAIMEAGRLVQVGPPAEVYEAPVSRYVAEFIGEVNLFEGEMTADPNGAARLMTDDGLALEAATAAASGRGWLAVRPEKLRLETAAPASGVNRIEGRVLDVSYRGDWSAVAVRTSSGRIVRAAVTNARRVTTAAVSPGDAVWLSFPPEAALALDR